MPTIYEITADWSNERFEQESQILLARNARLWTQWLAMMKINIDLHQKACEERNDRQSLADMLYYLNQKNEWLIKLIEVEAR